MSVTITGTIQLLFGDILLPILYNLYSSQQWLFLNQLIWLDFAFV